MISVSNPSRELKKYLSKVPLALFQSSKYHLKCEGLRLIIAALQPSPQSMAQPRILHPKNNRHGYTQSTVDPFNIIHRFTIPLDIHSLIMNTLVT
jgi:hypothetical protein